MTFAVPLTFRAFLLLLAFFGCVTGSSSNSNSIKDKNRESNRFIRRNLINFDGSTTSEILDDRELQIQFIIGGTEADLNDFPFFASLPVGCGATLIAPDILLSAAHCDSRNIDRARVGPGRTSYDVVARRRHPDFNDDLENDFLVLKLANTVPGITPAKINADFNVPTGNENIVVVGYGATEEGGSMSSTFQEVTLNNVPYSECVDVYGSDELDRDTMFCAGVDGGGKDSCQGDSGGPLLVKNNTLIVGVVSWGIGCAREDFPGVNARVSAAADWINNQICCLSSVPPSGCTCTDGDSGSDNDDIPISLPELRGCFSKDMTVQVLNVGEVAMEDLQLGDKVLTGNEYQEIYAFGHFHPTREAQFVQILFDLDGQLENLEVTGNHLVYVDGRTHPIRADSIKVGDGLLVGADKSHASVKKIRSIEKKGIYAPLTSRGSIVVNNIAASTYISLQDESPEYMQAGFLNISQQQICHLWMAPFRLMCKLGGGVGFCQTYNDDGRPAWVSIGMGLATWLPGQHIVLQMILFSIALFILSCLALVEKTLVLFVPVAAFLLVWINTKKPISKSIAKENKAGGKQKTV